MRINKSSFHIQDHHQFKVKILRNKMIKYQPLINYINAH